MAVRRTRGAVFVVLLGLASSGSVAPAGIPLSQLTPGRSFVGVEASLLPQPLPEVDQLDPIARAPEKGWPASRIPVAGMAYVSCTHLWTSLPDGGAKRRILDLSGISSPTFSPDGRTIAFLRSTAEAQEIWLTAADGSSSRRLGVLRMDGIAVPDTAMSFTWSPSGGRIAFALVRTDDDPWRGGSVVWTLHLPTGSFEREADGWPVPFWLGRGLTVASWTSGSGPRFVVTRGPRCCPQEVAGKLSASQRYQALTAGLVPEAGVTNTAGLTVAFLRRGPHANVELAVRANQLSANKARVVEPPPGFEIAPYARLAVTQDGSRVLVDLMDARDHVVDLRNDERQPVVGIVDPAVNAWTLLTYAWDPAASPVPLVTGPLAARRAVLAATDVLQYWNDFPDRLERILLRPKDPLLMPFRWLGFEFDEPRRADRGWEVPAVVYGPGPGGFGYRHVTLQVSSHRGRLGVDPQAASPLRSIRTIDDAVAFLRAELEAEVPPVAGLPPGAKLAALWPVSVGGNSGGLSLEVPGPDGKRHRLMIQFGQSWFSLGCGGVEGRPIEVGGSPALLGHLEPARQVIWPATPGRAEGTFGVYGEHLPAATLLAIAEAIEASR